jgi:paraquat-inducible protein B
MNEQSKKNEHYAGASEAVIREKKSFSLVWIVPIVALLIGGWLIYKAISEKGPEIVIVFETAEGLEAGKTKIKYKNVEIGKVTDIDLNKDLKNITVKAELKPTAKQYLTDKTRFWVVRARLRAGEISGLGTLMGGAYISIDPVTEGTPATTFTGLETPPIATAETEGYHFTLKSEKLGSLDSGSPVYFRQIEVGQVESYKLDDDGQNVSIRIFIDSPHHQYVRKNTQFWNAGGIDFSVDANGLRVDTQSVVSMMIGGLAFDNPARNGNHDPAENDDVFTLYNSHEEAAEDEYSVKHEWLLVFDGSVRGLAKGAPVEFKGIKLGKVLDINVKVDINSARIPISVLIEIEPERIAPKIMSYEDSERKEFLNSLIAKGLRAQLKSGNLLTGQLYVDLDFHPDEPAQKIDWKGSYPKIPTIQAPLDEAFAVFKKLIDKLDKIPFQQIGEDLHSAIRDLDTMIKQTDALMKNLNTNVAPEMTATLEQAKKSLAAMEKIMSSDSPLSQDARQALEEFSGAARSMRILADYLERHPEALIYGKGENK